MARLLDGKWVFDKPDTTRKGLQAEMLRVRRDEEPTPNHPYWHWLPIAEVQIFDYDWSEQLCAFV
jgi:hypothetical protein